MSRALPHKTTTHEMGRHLIQSNEEYFEKRSRALADASLNASVAANTCNTFVSRLCEQGIVEFYFSDAPAKTAIGYFSQAADAAASYFKLVEARGGKVKFRLRGSSYRAQVEQATQPIVTADSTLRTGLEMAMCSGNKKAAECLVGVSPDIYDPDKTNSLSVLLAMAVQTLCRGMEKKAEGLFSALVDRSQPGHTLDSKLVHAECLVLSGLAAGNAAKVSELLADYLAVYKKFYDNDSNNRRFIMQGLMSIFGLAVMVLARRRRMNIPIDSVYLPGEIVGLLPKK